MQKIMEINEFANKCGYFYNACIKKDISINNGYNCSHPEQQEKDTYEGEEIGKCYCYSCPLGREAEKEDFANQNIDNDGYTPDDYEEMTYIVIGK